MIPVGMVLSWLGYGFGTWGYVIVKGWDIPLRSWFSPLHPYQWPPGGGRPPLIPDTQVWPKAGSSQAAQVTVA